MGINWGNDISTEVRRKLETLFDTLIVDGLIKVSSDDVLEQGTTGRLETKPLGKLIEEVSTYDQNIIKIDLPHAGKYEFGGGYSTGRVVHILASRFPLLVVGFNTVRAFVLINTNALKQIQFDKYASEKINDVSCPLYERRTIAVVPDNAKPIDQNIKYYTMTKAKELFKFPPNHPIPDMAYAMIDVYPEHYVPISIFHEHYKQSKHAAFIELCANLGAKEICIESAEINNKEIDVKVDARVLLTRLGLGLSISQNMETGQTVVFEFSEKNSIKKDYDSPWLYAEPSWLSMNNLRRENHLQKLGAQFNCLDDMGINANLTANLLKFGINIGGSFHEMTKIRLSYKVVFWE